jgi:hypothetical protein
MQAEGVVGEKDWIACVGLKRYILMSEKDMLD